MSFLDELQRRNVIRVAIGYLAGAWLLIQILETLFPIFGIPETSIRLVVIIAAIGFVPVLVASWYFELTPDGLKRDSEVRELQREAVSHRTADRLIAAVLTLAVVYFAVDKFVLDPARDAAEREVARQEGRADALVESFGDRSIVVLPFENLGSEEDAYFAVGITDEAIIRGTLTDIREQVKAAGITRPEEGHKEVHIHAEGGKCYCPYCDVEVQEGITFCEACQSDLEEEH